MSCAIPDMTELALRMLRESLPGLRAVLRFGSSGSVYETPQSDLDLAVWCLPAVPDTPLWWLAQDLAAQCGRDVDLVNLNTASTVMQHQIITSGERLFATAPLIDIELFETHVLSEYASLNERRALILHDVLETGRCMADDVILNKVAVIQRCLGRIQEEYCGHEDELETNLTSQDSIVLNVQRACEASIDLAMHLVRVYKLGIPQDSRSAFAMLSEKNLVPLVLSSRLQAMTGFRNVAVRNYQKLSLAVLRSILKDRLGDFSAFATIALGLIKV